MPKFPRSCQISSQISAGSAKFVDMGVSQSDFMSLVISYLCTVACYHMTFKLPLTLPVKIERLENKTHKPLTAIRNSFNTAKWIVIV